MKKLLSAKELLLITVLAIPFITIVYLWGSIPQQVPLHFNYKGEVDNYGDKWTILLLPLINVGTYLILYFTPIFDPKGKINIDSSNFYYLRLIVSALLMCISLFIVKISIHAATENALPIATLLFAFFALMGNYMVSLKPNWLVGIRTPWTLSSESIWRKTHQLGGKLWFYGGLLGLLATLVAAPAYGMYFIILFTVVGSIVPIAYSFWLFRKEQQLGKSE